LTKPAGFLHICKQIRLQIKANVKKILVQRKIKPLFTISKGSLQVIVTLTSYDKRIENSVFYTLCSLLDQTEQPDRIILWLANDAKLTKKLEYLKTQGVEIKFCNDIKSYKKLIPSLQEYSNDILITADDDVFYPRNWIAQFKSSYETAPEKIHCFRAREILVDREGSPAPYEDWPLLSKEPSCRESIFPTGVGGILYPPHTLNNNCTKSELFMQLAPKADDMWFWAMAKLKGTEYSIIENGPTYFTSTIPNDKNGLSITNFQGENNKQLQNILNMYPKLKDTLIQIAQSNNL